MDPTSSSTSICLIFDTTLFDLSLLTSICPIDTPQGGLCVWHDMHRYIFLVSDLLLIMLHIVLFTFLRYLFVL